jgi:3-oxoacyl-[acyl-carrier-protein] synthase II
LLGDAAENLAILQLFGRSSRLAVSGTKGTTGHMMNAAGITETIITALALKTVGACFPNAILLIIINV